MQASRSAARHGAGTGPPRLPFARVRPPIPLSLEVGRPAGGRGACRGSRGAAAGRRCPGSSSGSSTRARSTGWRRGSSRARCSSRRRTARRRRRRWRPAILGSAPARRAQPLGSEPRLRRRLHPPPRRTARSSGSSRSTRRRCPRSRGASGRGRSLLGNLFRDQLDRYGELELVAARWRDAVASLPDAELVVNGDDPQVGDLARGRRRTGLRRRRSAARAPRAAARRRLEVLPALRDAVRLRRRLRRPPRRLPLPGCGHARPPLDVAARDIELHGLDGAAFTLAAPEGTARVELGAARPLQRLQRPRRRVARPHARSLARRGRRRARRDSRRRSGASSGSRSATGAC